MSINQRRGIPRLVGGGAMTFSRGMFLDGTKRCYFGPGQAPGVQATYAPPTDWPAAGMLLRVPQVAWFSCFFPGVFDRPGGATIVPYGDGSPTWKRNHDPGVNHVDREVSLLFVEAIPIDPPEFHTDGAQIRDDESFESVSIPNLGYSELIRARAAWESAKVAIEALRPGRTYLADHWYYADADYASGSPSANYVPGYPYLAGPPSFGGDGFGTDFLAVHYGNFAHGADFGDAGNIFRTSPVFADDPTHELELFYATTSYGRAERAHEAFAGYAVKLIGYEHDWATPPDPPHAGQQPELDAAFAAIVEEAVDSNAILERTASDLADLGVTYEGISAPTAGDFVNLIAAHFRFDPATGADLPPE